MSLLRVEGLRTCLLSAAGIVRAVDDVSFDVEAGETFALLGESGCGKSMTALSLMRLLPDAGTIAGGQVLLNGRDLLALSEAEYQRWVKASSDVDDQWVKEVGAKGANGQALLEEARALIRQYDR